jgi:hypothetical protein
MLLNDGLVPVPGTRQLGNGGRAKRHKRAEECQYTAECSLVRRPRDDLLIR